MRCYKISHRELLELPIYTFWEMSRNVDRVRADEERRLMVIFSQAFGGDPNKHMKHLDNEVGLVCEADKSHAVLDKSALNNLKAMLS